MSTTTPYLVNNIAAHELTSPKNDSSVVWKSLEMTPELPEYPWELLENIFK